MVSRAHEDEEGEEHWRSFPLDARVWGRALGLQNEAASTAVAKTWKRLEDRHLVSRSRDGRLTAVTSLREDGSGDPYTSPDGATIAERYLTLPFEYWTGAQGWYRTLSLPAKAMLLVASSLKPGFVLPSERAPRWYGISTESAERGLRTLREEGILDRQNRTRPAPLSPLGITQEWHYTLNPPFGPSKRRNRLLHSVA